MPHDVRRSRRIKTGLKKKNAARPRRHWDLLSHEEKSYQLPAGKARAQGGSGRLGKDKGRETDHRGGASGGEKNITAATKGITGEKEDAAFFFEADFVRRRLIDRTLASCKGVRRPRKEESPLHQLPKEREGFSLKRTSDIFSESDPDRRLEVRGRGCRKEKEDTRMGEVEACTTEEGRGTAASKPGRKNAPFSAQKETTTTY